MNKELKKFFTRERSLFYAHVWNSAEHINMLRWVDMNFGEICFRFENGLITVWYEEEKMDAYDALLTDWCHTKPEKIRKIINQYDTYWERVKPYFTRKTDIQTIEEMEVFYISWKRYFSAFAHLFELAHLKDNIPKEFGEKAFNMRLTTQEYASGGDVTYKTFAQNILKEQNHDLISKITPEEFFDIAYNEMSEYEKQRIREQRKDPYFLYDGVVLSNKHAQQKLKERGAVFYKGLLKNVRDNETVKGQNASAGEVMGVVRVIRSSKEFNNFQEGEILVCSFTSPEFLPVMKKSKAIIVEEGGLLSHAAITARELSIPCVVGVENAMQLFPTGSRLHVENGMITKLIGG